MNVMTVVISKYYNIVSQIRLLLVFGILLTAFEVTLYSQGASLPVYNGKDESINLIVYNSPINCKKNFAVQLNLKQGLRNSDELVQWKMDYTGCDGKRYTADMSTPIGIGAVNADDILSFASSYSNELNLEHAFINPSNEFTNVETVLNIYNVRVIAGTNKFGQPEVNEDNIEVLKNTVNQHLTNRNYLDAMPLLDKIVLIDPSDEVAWYLLGAAQDQSSLVNDAEASYQKAIQLNPKYAEALFNLGLMHYNQGLEKYGQCNKIPPAESAQFDVCMLNARVKFSLSVNYLERCYNERPNEREVILALKRSYLGMGNSEGVLRMDKELKGNQ